MRSARLFPDHQCKSSPAMFISAVALGEPGSATPQGKSAGPPSPRLPAVVLRSGHGAHVAFLTVWVRVTVVALGGQVRGTRGQQVRQARVM